MPGLNPWEQSEVMHQWHRVAVEKDTSRIVVVLEYSHGNNVSQISQALSPNLSSLVCYACQSGQS